MSSKIEVQRICSYCNEDFTARTTVTKYCSKRCSSRACKDRVRNEKVKQSNTETLQKRQQPIEQLKTKEFLTVRQVALLLNCSVRSTYYYIETGTIKAVNLGQRMTRVKRSEIDKLFSPEPIVREPEQVQFDISECYLLKQVQDKYSISERGLYSLIQRTGIPKIKKGKHVYVPKLHIDKHFS